jgi:wobble nucleotide-excising tRNase
MIKKIVLKDIASYDHNGVTFADLQKVNFIYGGNGTGKTTLSRVIKEDNPWAEEKTSEVFWEKDVENVLVYNKEFKEENLSEQMPGIFLMGEEWVRLEKQREELLPKLDKLKNKASRAVKNARTAQRQKETEKETLEELLWTRLHEPHRDFEVLMEGYGQKTSFAERMKYELMQKERDEKDKDIPGATVAGEEQRKRPLVTDGEELRRRYRELYGGTNADVDRNDLKNGMLFFEREMLRFDFWRYMLALVEPEMKRAVVVMAQCDAKIERHRKAEEKVRKEIEELQFMREGGEKMSRSVQPVIDRINKSLENYKFTGFSIQKAPKYNNCFQIQRNDGSYVKDTLSEGEATFITLLYFMAQATGDTIGVGDTQLNQVMVIDDPVSSLDDSVVHAVVIMINDLIKRIYANDWKENEHRVTQLIVMTHNYRFYKMLCGELRRKDVKRWMLTKPKGVTKAREINDESPVKDEYVVLWDKVRAIKRLLDEGGCDVDDVIEFPNIIRKILEKYFVEYGGYDRLALLPKGLSDNPSDVLMAKSLLKWSDEGSHGTGDDMFMEHPAVLAERYLGVFRELFVKLGQGEHYRMMMRVD